MVESVGPVPPGHFFLPGPTEVSPAVLDAQTGPMMPHRGAEIRALVGASQPMLQTVFGTQRPVFISVSSGTGMMEAAVRNGVAHGVLALVNGAFSERFALIAEACAKSVHRLEVEWGSVLDPEDVKQAVAGLDVDAVTLSHSETSTGALNPVASIAAAVREVRPDLMILVDSVSGAGGTPLHTDEWGLDFVLTGGQKALAIPPGLAFAVTSDRLLQRARGLSDRGFYFDIVKYAESMKTHETPTTPGVPLLHALALQSERISVEGHENRLARHRDMAERCWSWVGDMRTQGLAIEILAGEGFRSPTVTCLRMPAGVSAPAVQSELRRRGWVIANGYGKLMETTVRIGHMGDHTVEELSELLAEVEAVVRSS